MNNPINIIDKRLVALEVLVKANRELAEAKERASEIAGTLSKEVLDARMHASNQVREQLTAQATTFVDKSVYAVQHQEIANKVEDLRLVNAKVEGKADQSAVTISIGIAVVGILISIFNLVIYWLSRGGGH